MWFLYIIYSSSIDRYYVGVSSDITIRIERHNAGWGRYTKRGIPWVLKYKEEYESKSDAIKRENEIKRKKSRIYIESLISV